MLKDTQDRDKINIRLPLDANAFTQFITALDDNHKYKLTFTENTAYLCRYQQDTHAERVCVALHAERAVLAESSVAVALLLCIMSQTIDSKKY